METRASDIMTTDLVTGTPEMTIEEALKLLVNRKITGFPVVDRKGRLVGVLSEYDIIKAVRGDGDRKPLALSEKIVYTKKATVIAQETELASILRLFVEKKVRRLPVTDAGGKLVGIISRRDIMRVLYYRSLEI
jgi:CBS domain-containing protein